MSDQQNIHDFIGVGYGPSNLALAIALDEKLGLQSRLNGLYLEAKPAFAWHPDMLLDGSDMQVSFIKDLVSLRNPASPYSFLSYLHEKGRLERFINRSSFYPSRHEFNDYFAWAANKMGPICEYDQRVVGTEPVKSADGRVSALSIVSQNAKGEQSRRLTRDLVLAIGGRAAIPDVFSGLKGCPNVIHTSTYVSAMKDRLKPGQAPLKIAVVGSGQSGAEVFYDLVNSPARPDVDFIFRSHALKPSDDSPFVNEIFNVDFTSFVYAQSPDRRRALMEEYSNTNYSVVDGDLIEQLYGVFYEQDVMGADKYGLLRSTAVTRAEERGSKVALTMRGVHDAEESTRDYDIVILATGFERRLGETLLKDLSEYVTPGEVGRNYLMPTVDGFEPRIFLQGYCEQTHGLSDTLLSVLSVRVEEIADELLKGLSSVPAAAE